MRRHVEAHAQACGGTFCCVGLAGAIHFVSFQKKQFLNKTKQTKTTTTTHTQNLALAN